LEPTPGSHHGALLELVSILEKPRRAQYRRKSTKLVGESPGRCRCLSYRGRSPFGSVGSVGSARSVISRALRSRVK